MVFNIGLTHRYLLIWTVFTQVEGQINNLKKKCMPLHFHTHGIVHYYLKNKTINCRPNCPVGTSAIFSCRELYTSVENKTSFCLPNGKWTLTVHRCVPECGKRSTEVTLIVNGHVTLPQVFPWHAAIYNTIEDKNEFWCGGSLVSDIAVVTAAHCVWMVNPKNLTLAFGKYRREIDSSESGIQLLKAKDVKILETYQDASGNYNGDIAVIFLNQSVRLNNFIRPICLDWKQNLVEGHLKDGNRGTVLGWGLTENETFSNYLRVLNMPVASDEKCLKEQTKEFRKFVTYTSFCAGYKNGTGVCNGDSGGGLAFYDENSSKWYLQGIVSVSPRRKGTSFCDPRFYTVFTKVSMFTKWLKKLNLFGDRITNEIKDLNAEKNSTNSIFLNELTSDKNNIHNLYEKVWKYFEKYSGEKRKEGQNFPHTKDILTFSLPFY